MSLTMIHDHYHRLSWELLRTDPKVLIGVDSAGAVAAAAAVLLGMMIMMSFPMQLVIPRHH
jgi:hypothetical protein